MREGRNRCLPGDAAATHTDGKVEDISYLVGRVNFEEPEKNIVDLLVELFGWPFGNFWRENSQVESDSRYTTFGQNWDRYVAGAVGQTLEKGLMPSQPFYHEFQLFAGVGADQ